MVVENPTHSTQETLTDSERVDQYFKSILKDNQVGKKDTVIDYKFKTESSWLKWHRLRRSWFYHYMDTFTPPGAVATHDGFQYKLTEEDYQNFGQKVLKLAFLLNPELDMSSIKNKSPKALIKLAREDDPKTLAERIEHLAK